MKIHGDSNSGNCLKVKWVCDKLALPYAWIEIDTMKGGSRTPEFQKLNGWGQVPTVELDDGRTLAQSNAIIRYLARGSDLIPVEPYRAAQMDAWMFWEQNSHEPYVAVCRFHVVYLGKAVAELDPNLVKRGYVALDQLERHLGGTRFLAGAAFSLADVSLLAYTRCAHQGGFDLDRYPVISRWIGDAERVLGLPPAR
ncbi:glutathione S-transferase family protein [Bradyrhizobium lablabi]|uniref:glutathione S-transferase family protein n=1 Tax=Bradyrhizobium lablabi TaxID=722472 RepID=UPI001BAC4678|nr:glutathione S-transferase family protein [Bradyrhizobium lablabi]MBR0694130.1 glutathione S-transferase family protein [Bradyrhizobium lablabi]